MEAIATLIVSLLSGLIIFTLLSVLPLKFFARRLSWSQALRISFIAQSASLGLMFLYFLAESQMRLPRSIATLATMAALCVAGYLITTLSKEYGIEKTGRLGVGAKTIFGLFVMSWILVGAYALVGSYGKEQIHL